MRISTRTALRAVLDDVIDLAGHVARFAALTTNFVRTVAVSCVFAVFSRRRIFSTKGLVVLVLYRRWLN